MDPQFVMASAAVFQVILTGVLAWTVHRSTTRIARLDFTRSLREAWVAIDELALTNTETLNTADSLLAQKTGVDRATFARKRWFILAYLNPIATAYQGAREGIFGSARAEMVAGVRAQLEVLLRDDDAYWVSQNHGHEESFQDLCTEIWQKIRAPAAGEARSL